MVKITPLEKAVEESLPQEIQLVRKFLMEEEAKKEEEKENEETSN